MDTKKALRIISLQIIIRDIHNPDKNKSISKNDFDSLCILAENLGLEKTEEDSGVRYSNDDGFEVLVPYAN